MGSNLAIHLRVSSRVVIYTRGRVADGGGERGIGSMPTLTLINYGIRLFSSRWFIARAREAERSPIIITADRPACRCYQCVK